MKLLRLLVLCLLGLAAAASAVQPGEPILPPPPVFYVMRHLHTPEGERDPDLTAEGQRQANLLASWFRDEEPNAIFVSIYKRTQQTAAPLATRLGLEPIVYIPTDTPALITQARSHYGLVLIVGHSNTVPDIIEQLGGERPAPLSHPDFGDIWRVDPDGTTTRMRIEAPR